MQNENLLKQICDAIYDPKKDAIETINKFFHKDYEQCINGVYMNRAEYIQHVLEQRKTLIVDHFDFRHIIEKNNELFALYYVIGTNIQHHPLEGEVIAYFRFENEQVLRIHGQVRLLKGELADVDMN